MVDLKALHADPKPYLESVKLRQNTVDIAKLLKLDDARLKVLAEVEVLRGKLNIDGKPSDKELADLKALKSKLAGLENDLKSLDQQVTELWSHVPNLLAPETPKGGEDDNLPIRQWGDAEKKAVVDHQTWLEQKGWLDMEKGSLVAGNKFYYLMGPVVELAEAIKQVAYTSAKEAGFVPMLVPHLVNERIMSGTGFNPTGPEEQIYKIEGDDLYLIATSEIPLTAYHAGEIIDPMDLPIQYVGWSPSYRKEAGAYGKHSRGLYRVHQFDKLELYVFSSPTESTSWLEKLVALEERIAKKLQIPYRVTRTAAGDMGAPHYQKYDIEYWSPAEGVYRELTSASNCTDYQARRLNIRTKGGDGKTELVHTLNATAVAISRVLIALVENHQEGEMLNLPPSLAKIIGAKKL